MPAIWIGIATASCRSGRRATSTITVAGGCPTCPVRASGPSHGRAKPPPAPLRSSSSRPTGATRSRAKLQRRMAEVLDALPYDPRGTVGVIDETRCAKKGDPTPGVRRQYGGASARSSPASWPSASGPPRVRSKPFGIRTCSCPRCGMRTARDAGRQAFPTPPGIALSGRLPTDWQVNKPVRSAQSS